MYAASQNVYTVDRSRFRALLIPGGKDSTGKPKYGPIAIDEIEGFETEKSDNGDAGTFRLTAPLRAASHAAQVIAPMDLIAIFAQRISVTQDGLDPQNEGAGLDFGTRSPLNYGDGQAQTVQNLAAMDTCVFIGMVDTGKEILDPNGPSTFEIAGRDLTKIFIENDTFAPYTIPGGGGGQLGVQVLNLVLPVDQNISSWDLLLNALDVFCKKDPGLIQQISGSQIDSSTISQIAKYGYPWDNFIWYTPDDTFQHIPIQQGGWPPYSVQMGSVWTNVAELRNYPVARLFVSERGQLVFDSLYDAISTADPAYDIARADVLRGEFLQSDDDFATVIGVISAQMGAYAERVFGVGSTGSAAADVQAVIQRWGYRWADFVGQYIIPSQVSGTGDDASLSTIWKALWKIHNAFWRCSLTVRGRARYKVGDRVRLHYAATNYSTQPAAGMVKAWYIAGVKHTGGWGDQYTTQLDLRYPADVPGV